MNLQNCTAGPFASGNNGSASRQRLIELSHGLGALRHYNDLANHVLSLNQQGAVVTKLLGLYFYDLYTAKLPCAKRIAFKIFIRSILYPTLFLIVDDKNMQIIGWHSVHENLRRETAPLTYRYYVRQPLRLSRVSSATHALRTHVISIRSQGRNHPFIFYVPRILSIFWKWKKNRYWRCKGRFSKVKNLDRLI